MSVNPSTYVGPYFHIPPGKLKWPDDWVDEHAPDLTLFESESHDLYLFPNKQRLWDRPLCFDREIEETVVDLGQAWEEMKQFLLHYGDASRQWDLRQIPHTLCYGVIHRWW